MVGLTDLFIANPLITMIYFNCVLQLKKKKKSIHPEYGPHSTADIFRLRLPFSSVQLLDLWTNKMGGLCVRQLKRVRELLSGDIGWVGVRVEVAFFTGLVAWLEVTFSPPVHRYCSQSYLGVLADDK